MDINIKKPSNEEFEEKESSFAEAMEDKEKENWDMPVSGEAGKIQGLDKTNRTDMANRADMANRTHFEDARPKISEVSVPIEFPKMLNWWRAASRWALILFAALAPIFFLPLTALPVAANKEVLIFTLILVAFAALLGRILIEGRVRYPGHLLTAAFLVLVLVWGVSSFFSVNQIGSLIGPWATPDSFAAMFLFVLLALSIVMTFDRRDIVVSLLAFLASLSVLGLFEIFQLMKVFILPFSFAKNVAFNPVGSVNDLGILLAFGLILAAGLMSSTEMSKLLKKFLGISVAVLLLNLIIIDFWAIWVGLVLAMVFMISFLSAGLTHPNPPLSGRETNSSPDKGRLGGVEYQGLQLAYFQKAWLPSLILLVSLLLLFIPSPLARFIQTPVEVSVNFKATLDVARENLRAGHYLLGSGPNTFGYIFNLYKPDGINQTIFWSTVFGSGASAMASWAGTVGIFGVLSLLLLIIAFIWTGIAGAAIRNSSRGIMNIASQSVFVAIIFMFAMWFLYVANITIMAFTFWGIGLFLSASLIVGSSVSNISHRRWGKVSAFKEIRIFTSAPKTFIFSLLIVALMIGAVAGIYFEITRYVAEIYFGKAITASGKGDSEATIGNLNRAAEFWNYDERYFQSLSQATFFKLNALLTDKSTAQDVLRAQFQNITTNSIIFAQKAAALNSQNPFDAVLLGSIYENLIPFTNGASDFALSSYGRAVTLDPKNPSNYFMLGRVYVSLADMALARGSSEEARVNLEKSAGNLERAIALKQDYAPARFLIVQVYDRQGKLPEAVKRAEELVMLNNTDVGALFQLGFLYYKAGRFDDSKIVFERTVELSQNYSNARYFLGLIYDRDAQMNKSSSAKATEDRNKAIEEFRKIGELNPDNAEVKQILVNLKAGKAALLGIAPPAPAPQNRAEAPIQEEAPVQKLKK